MEPRHHIFNLPNDSDEVKFETVSSEASDSQA